MREECVFFIGNEKAVESYSAVRGKVRERGSLFPWRQEGDQRGGKETGRRRYGKKMMVGNGRR